MTDSLPELVDWLAGHLAGDANTRKLRAVVLIGDLRACLQHVMGNGIHKVIFSEDGSGAVLSGSVMIQWDSIEDAAPTICRAWCLTMDAAATMRALQVESPSFRPFKLKCN